MNFPKKDRSPDEKAAQFTDVALFLYKLGLPFNVIQLCWSCNGDRKDIKLAGSVDADGELSIFDLYDIFTDDEKLELLYSKIKELKQKT